MINANVHLMEVRVLSKFASVSHEYDDSCTSFDEGTARSPVVMTHVGVIVSS